MSFDNLWNLNKYWASIAAVLMIFYFVIQSFVYGYAFAYMVTASTTMFFFLRKEAEGVPFEEVWEDELSEGLIVPQIDQVSSYKDTPASVISQTKTEQKPTPIKKKIVTPQKSDTKTVSKLDDKKTDTKDDKKSDTKTDTKTSWMLQCYTQPNKSKSTSSSSS